MTLREFFQEIALARTRILDGRNRDMWIAWHTAMLTRAQTLPRFQELLIGDAHQPVQTEDERAVMWRHIGDMCGRVRKHNKRRVKIVRVH